MLRIVSRIVLIATGAALGSSIHAATITGRVVDTSNHPVASAIVTISEAPTSAATMHGASTSTAADGTFSFDALEAGTYLLCSQVPRGTLINPCQWTTTLPHVTLASATAASSITLTMRPGYRLPIHVDDSQGLLSAHQGKTPGAHLLIGVHGGYHFESAVIDASSPTSRDVSVLVPFDTPVSISVQSSFFKLQDSVGNAIAKATVLPVNVGSASPAAKLNVKVVGRN